MLHKPPQWSEVEKSMDFLGEQRHLDLSGNLSLKIFEQFNYVKQYITDSQIEDWNKQSKSTDERWVDCFEKLQTRDVPFKEFSAILEYIFCIPGTSAAVERVFSAVNKIWTLEKTRLQIKSLKSILLVKYNLEYDCLHFYNFLKTQPKLLQQISNQEKYSNIPGKW